MRNLLQASMAMLVRNLRRRRARVLSTAPRLLAATVVVLALTCRTASAREEFEGWHLEPAVGQAHLVMAVRVVSVGRVTVVEGAKTDVALREYRFQPVRLLKGLFQRDELSMTAVDLGIPAEDAALAPPLQEGEFRLLILVQQRRSVGCVMAAPGAQTFDERVPLLTGPDDPLVSTVETLIQVADSRSRRERATLLVDQLADVNGLAAVPLLSSLRLRADWAAGDGRAFAPLARLARDPQTPVHGAAVEVLRSMLASRNKPDYPGQLAVDGVVAALREILESNEANAGVRVAALESLGHLRGGGLRPLFVQHLTSAATYAEREAAASVLVLPSFRTDSESPVLDVLAGLPLDETSERESVYVRAAVHPWAGMAEGVLLTRLKQSIAARQPIDVEAEVLGRMRSMQGHLLSEEIMPLLVDAAGRLGLSPGERYQIATALGRLGDDRAVPVLVDWLRDNDGGLKERALAALETLDSDLAAREVRPLLKTEANLSYKLRNARLLARHGFDDGYALATEHLADEDHTAAAALVLAALDDPRTASDLSAIMAARPDRRWRAAALTGLAAIGDADAQQQLFDILNDDRHPLTVDAAEAAGLSDDADLLLPLAKLVHSRNREIALSSLVALRRFLSGVRSSPRGLAAVDPPADELAAVEVPTPNADVPLETRDAISEAVASLAVDAYVDANLRREAFAVARLLGGERYVQLLLDLADQAELEGSPLLAEVTAERRRLHGDGSITSAMHAPAHASPGQLHLSVKQEESGHVQAN